MNGKISRKDIPLASLDGRAYWVRCLRERVLELEAKVPGAPRGLVEGYVLAEYKMTTTHCEEDVKVHLSNIERPCRAWEKIVGSQRIPQPVPFKNCSVTPTQALRNDIRAVLESCRQGAAK